MKKIRKLLRLLLPYLLILLILAAGLCGSFFLIRNAKIYDASIVRHDAPDSRLLFVDAKEPLLLYIAATSRSVSTVLVVERPEKGKIQAVQRLVYT